jgi:hypothetical protein
MKNAVRGSRPEVDFAFKMIGGVVLNTRRND